MTAGEPRSSANQTKKLNFDDTHRLIGLKGLSRSDLLDSLGVIVFDTTCDINNPATKIAEAKADEDEKVASPETNITEEKIDIDESEKPSTV